MPANNMLTETTRSIEQEREQALSERQIAARERLRLRRLEEAQQADTASAEPESDGPRQAGPMEALSLMADQAGEGFSRIQPVVSDIGQGVMEAPGAILHGAIDGANSTLGLVSELGESIGRMTNFDPRLTWIDPETGGFRLGITTNPDEFRAALVENGVMSNEQATALGQLPEIPQPIEDPESVTGGIVESMAQFLTGFAAGGRALQAAGWAKAAPGAINWSRTMVQGALADLASFDGQEERLSNLIESVPALQNPVTEYLSATEDDPELLGRVKNAAEGAIVGPIADVFLMGLRAMHGTRRVKADLDAAAREMAQADQAAQAAIDRDILRVGDPAAPAVYATSTGRVVERQLDQALTDIETGARPFTREDQARLLETAQVWADATRRVQPERSVELDALVREAGDRMNQGEYQHLMNLMEQARKPHAEAQSLFDFVRGLGGLVEDGGELEALGALQMRMRRGQAVSTNSGLEIRNDAGLTLDRAAEAAAEAGYIGSRTADGGFVGGEVNELLDALRREASGERVYSEADYDAVFADAARADLFEEIEMLRLDPDAPVRERRSQARELAAWEPGEPLTVRDMDALDRAMDEAGARNGIGSPAASALGGEEVRINFNALNTGDDIRSVIGQLADQYSGEVNAARRLGRKDADVLTEASAVRAWDALQARRVGEPLSDAQVRGAQSLYIASAENIRSAIQHAAEAGSDEAHYAVRRALSMHRAIQAEIAGAKADAARALRAWGVPTSADATARRQIQAVLNEHGGRFTDDDLARLRVMAGDVEELDRAVRYTSKTRAVAEVGADVLRFAWLSGPQTHIANMVGNTLTTVYDTLPRLMSGIKGRILGDAELERQLGAALAEYTGLAAGVRAQLSAFARSADYGRMGRNLAEIASNSRDRGMRRTLMDSAATILTENPVSATFRRGRFDDRGVSGKKFVDSNFDRAMSAERFGVSAETRTGQVLNGAGRLLSAPTDFLGFQDDFFKGVNELATRYRVAYEQAVGELGDNADRGVIQARMVELIEDPSPEMLDEARRAAQRRTFTEPVGEGTRAIMTIRNFLNRGGIPFGHVLLPFVVTPSNILKYAFTNSPAGAVFREVADDIRAGGVRREVAEARVAAGTALFMVGLDMAANGQITGRAPSDPGERQALERTGWQEYSVKIDDSYYSFRRMEPVSTMLMMAGDLHGIISRANDDPEVGVEVERAVMAAAGAMINAVTSKTYLTGVAEFVQFTEDPERYGANYGINLASGILVPTGVSQIERAIDPQIRDAQSLLDRLAARIPGLSDTVPQQYDLWGRPRVFESGNGRVYDALAPFQARRIDPAPIDAELIRLNDFPRMPSRNISVRTSMGVPVTVNLRNNPALYARYVQLAGNEAKFIQGQGAYDFLNSVVSGDSLMSSQYDRLPDSAAERNNKGDFIRSIIDAGREAARAQMMREHRDELTAMADAQMEALQAADRNRMQELSQ